MKLSEINLPISYEWGVAHVLIFTQQLAQQLAILHSEYGDPNIVPSPVDLTDGRYMLSADILTECVPGGSLHSLYSIIDKTLFDQIDVVPTTDIVDLLPKPIINLINDQ